MFELALDAGLNAYAAPLGMLEAASGTYAGTIPTILKVNSSNSLSTTKDQAVTATVQDALRLGCSAIGFTIYPGSEYQFEMMEELRELAQEAKACGLAVVVWSYPRGPMLDKVGETALDICAYAAHMAALVGAHIIKVKPPTGAISLDAAKKTYEKHPIEDDAAARFKHIVNACFGGRRLVVFSGGEAKGTEDILKEVRAIHAGGGNGSIMGRNAFQRPKAEALKLLSDIIDVYSK
jgi:class I fructose-bisphosphate aldolase